MSYEPHSSHNQHGFEQRKLLMVLQAAFIIELSELGVGLIAEAHETFLTQ